VRKLEEGLERAMAPDIWIRLWVGKAECHTSDVSSIEQAEAIRALGGQKLGIKEVDDGIWLVSFMTCDLGYIDLEQKTLQTIGNPFGPSL
jgi:hypothetical protein